MRISLSPIVLAVVLLASCASTPNIVSLRNDEAELGIYKTIAYAGSEDPPASYKRTELPEPYRKPLADLIRAELLEKRRYEEVPAEDADLLLWSGVGTRVDQKSKTAAVPTSLVLDVPDRMVDVERDVDVGTLVFVAVDRKRGIIVWRGQATATVEKQPDGINRARLQKTIEGIFEAFPPAAETP